MKKPMKIKKFIQTRRANRWTKLQKCVKKMAISKKVRVIVIVQAVIQNKIIRTKVRKQKLQ